MLKWARENSGFVNNIDLVAKKLQQKRETIELWEEGKERPTFKQLIKIANVYKRPVPLFYLKEPPKDFKPINDYRRLPDVTPLNESPQLNHKIRKARYRRQIAIELFEELDETPPKFTQKIALSDDPEVIGEKIRNWLKVDKGTQTTWKDDKKAFRGWRQALEEFGVLVFQTPTGRYERVKTGEMRGFAISDRPLPVIVVNSKDSPKGRIFSLLHELAHILLDDSGISGREYNEGNKTEVFCNHVAGATLLPSDWFQEDELLLSYSNNWNDETVKEVAQYFKVSRDSIWRRLSILKFVSLDTYQEKHEKLLNERKVHKKAGKKGGGPPVYRTVISTIGKSYTELVLSSYYQDKINSSDVSDYLGMKLKHLPNIERAIFKSAK